MGKTTTDMQLVPIGKLVPYANNARIHSPEQVTKLRSSLREFGFINPVIIDRDYGIIAGHGRVMAAKAEGINDVPCVFVDHLTEAQKKAYILADNRFAMDAGWDEEMLRVEMEALQGMDFNLDLTGFDEAEIADLFTVDDGDGKEDDFDVDAELEKPCISQPGDVWHLGKHRVICGDSTLPETYSRLLGNEKVNLVCTDPPYMVKLESTSGKIKNDDLSDKEAYEFLTKAFGCFHEAMAKDASIYVFYATAKVRIFHDAYEDAGFKVGAGLVWKKNRLVLTRTDWKYIHEPIIWGWRKDGKHTWYGDQKQTTVFEFDRIKDSRKDGCGHPSSKPVPLIAYLIKQCTQTNGTEVWHYHTSRNGKRLAECIQRQIVDSLGTTDRGAKGAVPHTDTSLYVLNNTDAVSVLVETAFVDNPYDEELLRTRQDNFARAIARGVTDYELEVSGL